MPHSPLSRYLRAIEQCELSPDTGQEAIVRLLQSLYEQLEQASSPSSRPLGLLNRLTRREPEKTVSKRGLYLWGGVGRGKSMLMDMFYASLTSLKKRRVHFHAFMLEVHQSIHLHRQQQEQDSLAKTAAEIAASYEILCFDELQVQDITDAMILSRLFTILLDAGCLIVFTSNRPPEELYKDGLQRERFLPFIALIRQRMQIVEISSSRDYRQDRLRAATIRYATPLDAMSNHWLQQQFQEMTGYECTSPMEIPVLGRMLHVPKACRDMAWFHYRDLCALPLAAQDYLALSECFRVFFIEGIPRMSADKRNEAKRFVTLIDILYEHRCLLFCTAETQPEQLYPAGDGSFEFERTASRLREMMAGDYII